MRLSPLQSLVFLVLAALAISGWLYGIHWKRIASGSGFTAEEKALISLQDQVSILSEENAELRKRLEEKEPAAEAPEEAPASPE